MKLIEKLSSIQKELKVPKNLYNKFGNYYFRNCETILEEFKTLQNKHRVCLLVSDNVVERGNKIYVEAIATLYDLDSEEKIESRAYARESDDRKGMDDAQITGATSSYARKYALNGLFLIDDNKDADTDEFKQQASQNKQTPKTTPKTQTPKSSPNKKASDEQIQQIRDICNKWKVDVLDLYTSNNLTESTITAPKAKEFIDGLKKKFEGK